MKMIGTGWPPAGSQAALQLQPVQTRHLHIQNRRMSPGCPGDPPPPVQFVADSPLEGTGFEPSVPRQEKWSMPSSSDQTRAGRTLTLGGGGESSLEGRDIELSVSPKDIRTSPYDLCANRSDRRQSREGDGGSNPLSSSGESANHRFLAARCILPIRVTN